jgi:UDP-N-acetylglucosamine 2-epimerase
MARKVVATVFGTRPEIIKLSTYIEEMDGSNSEHFLVHTNQHYDYDMDEVFMEDLHLRRPDFRLATRQTTQARQFGHMIMDLSGVFEKIRPDIVVVLGDTDSTAAGAFAAKKSDALLAHIESGCRSFDKRMPEEQNRIVVDHLSDLLFAPTKTCVENLQKEGISPKSIRLVGSTLVEVCRRNLKIAERSSTLSYDRPYAIVTIHRRGNIEDSKRLKSIMSAVGELSREISVVFPIHPHTRARIEEEHLEGELENVEVTSPLGYLDFIKALSQAEFVLTDSGGVQQEAQVLNVPIITARRETEWVETVESGSCILADANRLKILRCGRRIIHDEKFRRRICGATNPYLEKGVAKRIVGETLQVKRQS